MTPDTIDEAVVCLGILVGFFALLALCGLLADYVLPHIPFAQRYIDSLPEYEDDTELYQQEMEWLWRNRAARRKRVKRPMRRLVNGNRV